MKNKKLFEKLPGIDDLEGMKEVVLELEAATEEIANDIECAERSRGAAMFGAKSVEDIVVNLQGLKSEQEMLKAALIEAVSQRDELQVTHDEELEAARVRELEKKREDLQSEYIEAYRSAHDAFTGFAQAANRLGNIYKSSEAFNKNAERIDADVDRVIDPVDQGLRWLGRPGLCVTAHTVSRSRSAPKIDGYYPVLDEGSWPVTIMDALKQFSDGEPAPKPAKPENGLESAILEGVPWCEKKRKSVWHNGSDARYQALVKSGCWNKLIIQFKNPDFESVEGLPVDSALRTKAQDIRYQEMIALKESGKWEHERSEWVHKGALFGGHIKRM